VTNTIFTPRGVAAAFGGMFLVGALEALYGPSLIRIIDRFDADPSTVGIVISAHFVGGLLGVLTSQNLHNRIGNKTLLSVGYLLLIIGSVSFAWAPTLTLAITASALAGLGFGALDYALSHLFAVAFTTNASRMLNYLHGFFGLGAITAPLVVALFGPERYPAYFTGFAILALITALGITGVSAQPTQSTVSDTRSVDVSNTQETPRPLGSTSKVVTLFALMVAVFVLHVAVGSGIGTWEASYLSLQGMSVEFAAAATSIFWLSMTISRFALASVIKTTAPATVVIASCLLMFTASLSASIDGIAIVAFAIAGFAIGPIFPTALAWATQLFGEKTWVSGYLIALSMIGGIAFPPLLGMTLGSAQDTWSLPMALAALSLLTLAAAVIISVANRGLRKAGQGRTFATRT